MQNILSRLAVALFAASTLSACATVYSVSIPLTVPTASNGGVVAIDDQRDVKEKKIHFGKNVLACERWYGDDSFTPLKMDYLKQLFAARAPAGATIQLKIERFDTIEYCENTSNRAAAAAAGGASGIFIPSHGVPFGDSVLVRLKGDANGAAFDVARQFDYSDLKQKFSGMPSDNPQYRERLGEAMTQMVDEILAKK